MIVAANLARCFCICPPLPSPCKKGKGSKRDGVIVPGTLPFSSPDYRYGIGSKSIRAILICPYERHFSVLGDMAVGQGVIAAKS